MQPCLMRIGEGGTFGQKVLYESEPYTPGWFDTEDAATLCRKDHWDAFNACGSNADFRLVIVEPEEFRTKITLRAFYYKPLADEAHIDHNHPVHGQVLDVLPPVEGGDGCAPQDWLHQGRNLTGQIALTRRRASCSSVERIKAALASGQPPAAYVMADYHPGDHLITLGGSSVGVERVPAHMAAGALWYVVQEATQRGARVRAKIELACPSAGVRTAVPPVNFTDGCPDDRLRGVWNNATLPEDRLCSKCPLQLVHGGSAVCVYGSRLYPMLAANFFQGTRDVPSEMDVVYVDLPPWGGCSRADFDGVEGKVVAFLKRGCMEGVPGVLNSARLAQRAGAVGVVYLSANAVDFMLSGPSILHDIPIHTVSGDDTPAAVALFQDNGIRNGTFITLTMQLVGAPAAPDAAVAAPEATDADAAVSIGVAASFEATPGVIVALVLIPILAVASVWKAVMDFRIWEATRSEMNAAQGATLGGVPSGFRHDGAVRVTSRGGGGGDVLVVRHSCARRQGCGVRT
eukprot:TRINITY_DN3983_c0_g1_i1.p1 TRINITY_DN3983_c0_g1~~TRINITY_DN3983_c0_g1_i1.p1  ORF type:complete len:516 (+),score=58.37 TRINITY_DN3983_c0_g1_i1:167-1714(+)